MAKNSRWNNFWLKAPLLFRRYWHIILSIFLVLCVGLFFAWVNRNEINPDGVAYIQVARHYANFQFKEAINGYWSPLLSWLLVPFIWLKIEPLLAFRLISFLLTLAVVLALAYYLNKGQRVSRLEKVAQFCFLSGVGVLLSGWGSSILTPDFLSGFVLLAIIVLIHKFGSLPDRKYSVLLGISLAGLYFAKYVGLYVSVAILILLYFEFRGKGHYRRGLRTAAFVFLALSLSWVAVVSVKYHEVTTTTSTSYNFSLIGPDRPEQPIGEQGVLRTHYGNELWAWDDPSYLKMPTWKINKHFSYYLNTVFSNINNFFSYLFSLSAFVVVGILIAFRQLKQNTETRALLLSMLVISTVYCLILIEQRYLWMFAVPLVCYCAVIFKSNLLNTSAMKSIVIIIGIASLFSVVPVLQNGYRVQLYEESAKNLSISAKNHVPEHAFVAAPYRQNYTFCYFTDTTCLGVYQLVGSKPKIHSLILSMRNQGINYYVEYGRPQDYGLPLVFTANSTKHKCYDFSHDQHIECGKQSITVYRLQ